MIFVTLSITAPSGKRKEMVEAFWSLIGPTRAQPGSLSCGVYRLAGSRDRLLYVEEWETVEQLECHMRSARYQRLLAIIETAAELPVLRYLCNPTVKGMEYVEAIRLVKNGSSEAVPDPDEQ
jgi:quinol monooxygenase YgiN